MKGLFILYLISGITTICLAQKKTHSLEQRINEVYEGISIDSLPQHVIIRSDSLLSFQKIDSIRKGFNQTADSIKFEYQTALSKIDSQRKKLNNSIDSLSAVRLPTDKYTKALNSLNQLRQKTETQFTSKLEALKSKTTDKLNALDLPPEFKEPLQKFTKNIDGLDLNSDIIKMPKVDIPGYTVPDIDGLDGLATKAGDVGEIGNAGPLSEMENPVRNLNKLSGQAKVYQEDIKNITEGNLNDVQAIPERIEEQASKIEGIDDLQSGVIEEHKAQLDNLAGPKNVKEKAKEIVKKAAVDHFAGKQEQLKAAMEKVAKYKQKYSSVSSIKDLLKRPPNPMKGKPFVERLVPGLYLQYQRKNFYLLDVNPYAE